MEQKLTSTHKQSCSPPATIKTAIKLHIDQPHLKTLGEGGFCRKMCFYQFLIYVLIVV